MALITAHHNGGVILVVKPSIVSVDKKHHESKKLV